jgi:hypothetical protein
MIKKTTFILLILAMGLTSIASSTGRLMRLTIINKAGRKIEISLTGKNHGLFYYLHIPEGSTLSPTEKVFTIIPDLYSSNLYYVELWDPVYGNQCGTKGQTLDVTRNVVVMVLPCDRTPANGGEFPSLVKFGGRAGKRGR